MKKLLLLTALLAVCSTVSAKPDWKEVRHDNRWHNGKYQPTEARAKVPDNGSTLLLLGGSLAVMTAVARRKPV